MAKEDVDNNPDFLKPELRELVSKIYSNVILFHNLPMEMFECKRTLERQEWLVKQGFSKTLNSRHLDGSAVDFVFRDPQTLKWSWDNSIIHYYDFMGARVMELYGDRIEWGGKWKTFVDKPHYQLKI